MNYLDSVLYRGMTRRDWGNLIRIVRGINTNDMAEELGLKPCSISQFEAGKSISANLSNWYNSQIEAYHLNKVANELCKSKALLRMNEKLGGK